MQAARLILLGWVCGGLVGLAAAGGHRDWTAVPLGSIDLEPGSQTVTIPLPRDAFGVIPAPLSLAAVVLPEQLRSPIEVTVGLGDLPPRPWKIEFVAELFVIGPEALAKAADPNSQTVALGFEVPGKQPLRLMVTAAPDMRLAGEDWVGPLGTRLEEMPSGLAREYLRALRDTRHDLDAAKRALTRLGGGSDPLVSRFAREQLRRVRLAELETQMKPSLGTTYRMGLYAQFAGQYRSALRFFAAAAEEDAPPYLRGEILYRLGETMLLCRYPVDTVAAALREAAAVQHAAPNTWDLLLGLVRASDGGDPNRGARRLTDAQIDQAQTAWRRASQMIFGAARGRLAMTTHQGELPRRPAADYDLAERYDYDLIMLIDPAAARPERIRGEGLTAPRYDMPAGGDWTHLLATWATAFDTARRRTGAAPGCPPLDAAHLCGFQPAPALAAGQLAALRYHVPPNVFGSLRADGALGRASTADTTFSWQYKWEDVRDDIYTKLPRVTAEGLHDYVGLSQRDRIIIRGAFAARGGYLAISSTRDQPGRRIQGVPIVAQPSEWDPDADNDMQLNNVLDTAREMLAVFPFRKDGRERHLLIMKPEAVEAVLYCLREGPEAARVYGGRAVRQRILGWILAGDGAQRRVFIVADTILPSPLPPDEEDLLSPQ